MTHQRNETPEPLAQEQAGEMPPLPMPSCTYADHSYPAFTKTQMREYAIAALQAKDAEIARLKADAGRWSFVRHHWSNAQMRWNNDETNSLKSVTLTIKTAHWTSAADAIESQIDAAIDAMKGEAV